MDELQPIARRGVVRIEGKVSPEVYRFISQCTGYTKWLDDQGVVFDASRAHITLWNKLFPDNPITDADGTVAKLQVVFAPVVNHPRMTTPRMEEAAHTKRAVSIALSRNVFGFFHDMGTRKTALMINIMAELWARNRIDRALVITTKRGMLQFLNEQLVLHQPTELACKAALMPTRKGAKFLQYPDGMLLIAVTSPGAFQSDVQTLELHDWCERGRTAIFVDESQNFKGWSAKRVKNLLRFREISTHRYLFSGEPQPNGYVDLYAQFAFLDPNILGHKSITSFKNAFCIFGGYKMKEIVAYQHKEELAELIAPHCEYLKITDCIDMPERIYQEARFKPTDEQRELYNRMRLDFVAEVTKAHDRAASVDSVQRVCKNAASKFIALQQIANGWLAETPDDEGNPGRIAVINDERALYTVETQVGDAKKCIVWARFHADLASLARAFHELGVTAVSFHGKNSDAQNEANKQAFLHNPSVRVFYGTAASGGTSLNLQVANRMVYFSNSFNWNDRTQSERRIWRSGQHWPCTYVDIMGFLVDRLIRNNALKKEDLSTSIKTLVGLAALAEQLKAE